MYFVMEYRGNRKMAQAKPSATFTEVNHLAFGFSKCGDERAKETQCLWASRSRKAAEKALHSNQEVAQ